MRRAALLAIASLAAAAPPEVRVPPASEAKPLPEGAAVVSLTADGLIVVEREGKPETVSIEKLGLWLADRIAKSARKPGDAAKAEAAAAMTVLLRADGKAPWLHVQRLLETCAEAGIRRTAFGVKGARGEEGQLGPPGAPSRAWDETGGAKLAVRIAVTREETAVWGPAQTGVRVPAELTYRMGGIEAREIDAVRRYLRDAGQTAAEGKSPIQAVIEPDAKVPWETVVAVLDEYHRAGRADVKLAFVEPALAADERRAARLPYPSR
ncbi:MAG: biopolymer transporter ExbD [Planctomycetes bacterium]|nr:biopolymer transporter ExbD [Planctomycetota bacterium]